MRLALQIEKTVFIEYKTKGTPEDFQNFMRSFLGWMSQKVIDRLQEVVRKRLYNWHRLSPAWLHFKEKMGLDPRIWLASGQVTKAIRFWYDGLSDSYYIGVHPRALHRKYVKGGYDPGKLTRTRILDIVRWLEFGTRKMKPRPLFVPVLNEFKGKSKQQKLYQEYIKEMKGLI